MEKESFFKRFKCLIIQPARFLYESRQRIISLNEKRLSVGVSPISNSLERIKNSLFLADTFFGFEVRIDLILVDNNINWFYLCFSTLQSNRFHVPYLHFIK